MARTHPEAARRVLPSAQVVAMLAAEIFLRRGASMFRVAGIAQADGYSSPPPRGPNLVGVRRGSRVDVLVCARGVPKPIAPHRSPDLGSLAERWIRSAREERLDQIALLNERHLRWALDGFVRYYNERRPRRAKRLRMLGGGDDFSQAGQVVRYPVLGDVINDFYRKAA